MYLSDLSVLNFKNYPESTLSLHKKINCFVGNNGVGKTNILDAVYYLCMCKSYFNNTDQFVIRNNEDFMVLQGSFSLDNEVDNIYCGLKSGKKKVFRKNKKEYHKLSDHIGLFPVVMISPSDSSLIIDTSEERRKYMNAVISQYDKDYLENVIHYNKILAQRNKLLKDIRNTQGANDLLLVYDEQLLPLGNKIHISRKDFIEHLTPVFKDFYRQISEGKEQVELNYLSQLNNESFEVLIKNNHQKDLIAQYTTTGIHKDDLEMVLLGSPIKKIGSQGQQKTFLVALKLAQFKFLSEIKNFSPILLLDDIFDKFDVNRVSQILHLVSDNNFGQILITHTNEYRMKELLKKIEGGYKLFKVEENQINLIDSEEK
ncbi:MAG: DNA replication and repair protein RecF [Bacteroidales bacterium]|nr:DNA replication and repair protein RecF [Bacteroidales bacterium]MBN2819278.1 DNA replication and repair protein RecF [Bacteroidales bacterium]